MKKHILSLSLIAALGLSSCGNAQSKAEGATNEESTTTTTQLVNKDVDVDEFEKLVASGNGLLLDVRTDAEYADAHLKGSTQMDFYANDFKEQVQKLDPTTPVYVYCRSGGRSGNAADIMKGMGFLEVYNLEGGITAWQGAGKPVEK